MKIEFDVQITWKHLYRYLLYTAYHGPAGLVGTCIGALLIALYFWQNKVIFIIGGIIVILYTPYILFRQALQKATMPVYLKPLHYTVSDEGISVTQEGNTESTVWEGIFKVTSSTDTLYIFMNPKMATIWPKKDLGDAKDAVISMISTHIDPAKNKIKE